MKYSVQGLNKLSREINQFVKEIGFDNNDVPLRIALIHSEVSEAFEAFRNDRYADWNVTPNEDMDAHFKRDVKDTFEDEVADILIRTLDLCGKLDINIETHIQAKMKHNASRGHKYGGKKF